MMSWSFDSACDGGRSLREAHIHRSLLKVFLKATPVGSRLSRAYDELSRWSLELMERGHLVQILDKFEHIVGSKAWDVAVKPSFAQNVTQCVGKLGRRLVQLKKRLEVVAREHRKPRAESFREWR